MAEAHFDVAVVGSGPAACAASLALTSAGLQVAQLMRKNSSGRITYGEHMAPGAKPHMSRLGLNLEDILNRSHHRPSNGILSCWGGIEPYSTDYMFSPFGTGWNLDRNQFDRSLASVTEKNGTELLHVTRVCQLEEGSDGWTLAATSPLGVKKLNSQFLIDATGRSASLARRLGSRPRKADRLVGLYAHVSGVTRNEQTLVIEACSDGWWYSVPLANGDHVAVYMTDSDLLPAGRAAITKFWLRRFVGSEHVKRRIGYLANPPDVRVAPASTQCLDTHAGNRWLAVGDASMAFDPLAAVGMEKAFEDGCLAADHVSSILRGQPWTPDDYTNIQNRAFAEYLDERHHYYSLEQRWNNSKFWTRRRMFAPNKDKTRLAIHKSK